METGRLVFRVSGRLYRKATPTDGYDRALGVQGEIGDGAPGVQSLREIIPESDINRRL